MISWIWVVPARAVGMGFAYGFVGFDRFPNLVFSDPPLFDVFVFGFERGLEIGMIPGGTKHAIPLWFATVGALFDRRFVRKRPPIEMIEMIKMIKMIEMFLGWLGGDALHGWGAPVRGSSG